MALLSAARDHRKILRRIASVALIGVLVANANGLPGTAAESTLSLQCQPYTVGLNVNGAVVRVEKQGGTPVATAGAEQSAGDIVYGTTSAALGKPVTVKRSGASCTLIFRPAALPAIEVHLFLDLRRGKNDSLVLRREVTLASQKKLTADLTFKLPLWPRLSSKTWLPLFGGTGGTLGNRAGCAYKFAGALPADGVRLSIPMVSGAGGGISPRVTIAADPYFSTLFTPENVAWTYPKRVGLDDRLEKRAVVTVFHAGSAADAVEAFFAEALPGVPAGPAWLHEIAMVDYDYMSDAGKGWFADIDALTKALRPEDRPKVFLCLHGWYDWVGRYCFDAKKGKFDEQWSAFGNYEKAKFQPSKGKVGNDEVDVGFAKCLPVRLSLGKLHQRLSYAKSRGFRVGMYFADGTASSTGLPDFSPGRVLRMGGWAGPDVTGKAYDQNPLVPAVYRFYLAYTDALLAEFGPQVDAFVWDETFRVPTGSLGSDAVPGYADRAMMRLVRAVAKKIEGYNARSAREIALLASDDLYPQSAAAPYALVAHGTYQDSWCDPQAWSNGIFPNYRNVMWSCCWWPVHQWQWIEFGVRRYQAPVAISNGWGDNLGFSELSPQMRQNVLTLFQWRKQKPTRLKFLEQLPAYR
jgi:hypothetical protein